MITYKQGNLITAFKNGEINAIAHQTNCTFGLGAGFAKLIANEFPHVVELDKKHRESNRNTPEKIVGSYLTTSCNHGWITNLYGQFYTGSPANEYFDTFDQRCNWLRSSMLKLVELPMFKFNFDLKIGIPLLASHRGACQKRRIGLTDLEYFQKYIEPLIPREMDITVYYL